MRSYDDSLKIEKAIKYLVKAIEKSGNNTKPVILHSIRVAFYLESQKYSTEIVIAALLHDLLEDSETRLEEIESLFSTNVADLVKANSFDESIKDEGQQKYKETFDRCLKAGKDALIIKAADILDNSDYYPLVKDESKYFSLLEKMKCFVDLSRDSLKDEPVYGELLKKYTSLKPEDLKR